MTAPSDKTPQNTLKLSDTVIAMIRDLLQIAIYTATPITDMFRAMRFDIQEGTTMIVPTPGYVEAYNKMIEDLEANADELHRQQVKEMAAGDTESSTPPGESN